MSYVLIRSTARAATALLAVLIASPCVADPGDVDIIAIAGQPFGVAKVTIQMPPGTRLASDNYVGLPLVERNQRIHYPAFDEQPLRGLLRNILNRPGRATTYFLFHGIEPLEIDVFGDAGNPLVLRPLQDPVGHRQLLLDWWETYTEDRLLARLFGSTEEPPPQVKNYLSAMLARRLNLRLPDDRRAPAAEELGDPLGLMLGTEEVRLALQRDGFMAREIVVEVADRPLPKPIMLPVASVPEPPVKVEVEPLALRVPEECFYVRFGNYANFQWLRSFLSQIGGDLRNLITVRGVSYGVSPRLERQLVLKSSLLGDLFGGLTIADVALIGTDTFVREGAAIGVLFEARNSALLNNNLRQQRDLVLTQNKDATEQQIEIGGRQVSLLSTPDNSVRSFYVVDGDYHLVTTSRAIVERFLETGQGTRPLGKSPEFVLTRANLPISREFTIFAYLSTPFLQNLISPQYRIEMTRRLQASGDLELLYLAQLAARGEGRPGETVDDLISGGFLPPQFGRRPDGSRVVLDGDIARDSLRGGRGSFVPVPDVAIGGASVSELAAYQALAEYTHAKVQYLEPVVAAIHRQPVEGKSLEHVTIDLRLSPVAESQFRFLSQWLSGPPDKQRMAPVPGDLVQIEAMLGSKHVFAGLRDCNPAQLFMGQGGLIGGILGSLTGLPWERLVGYVGAAGGDPALGFLAPRDYGPADAQGYSRTGGLVWRRDFGQFAVLSFHPDVLAAVAPQLQFQEAERAAHARIRAVDLRGTQLHEMLDMLALRRAEATTRGNLQFVNSLTQQMHVPTKDSLAAAERILDARLIAPLGGEYVLSNQPRRPHGWIWQPPARDQADTASTSPPPFENPLLKWFRGMDGDVLLEGRTLLGHFEVDMDSSRLNGQATNNNGLTGAFDFLNGKAKAKPAETQPAAAGERP